MRIEIQAKLMDFMFTSEDDSLVSNRDERGWFRKMVEENMNPKGPIECYLEIYRAITEQITDSAAAIVILQEVAKDRRTLAFPGENNPGNGVQVNGEHASQKQIRYLKKLGITPRPGLTKDEASDLIDSIVEKAA